MANNYFDGTGVLVFDGEAIVTPIIRGLFSAFNLEKASCGATELYIARISEETSTCWSSILESMVEQLNDIPFKLPDDFDDESWEALLNWLQTCYKPDQEVFTAIVESIVGEAEDDCDADLDLLYRLAVSLQDGHNLKAIKFEGCWHCSKPRLFEFGGGGEFYGRYVEQFSDSQRALALGESLEKALALGNLPQATEDLFKVVRGLLAGIKDDAQRASVTQMLSTELAKPIPTAS